MVKTVIISDMPTTHDRLWGVGGGQAYDAVQPRLVVAIKISAATKKTDVK